jgi:hypothetical protein
LKINYKGIVLIGCVLLPLLGAYFFLQYQKKQIKREVKWKMIEGLDVSELVIMKFSKEQTVTELNWKHTKEFEYQGEMYDIVEKHDLGDSIEYVLWWDYAETLLNQQLQALVSFAWLHHPSNKQTKHSIQLLMKSLFCLQNPTENAVFLVNYPLKFNCTSANLAPMYLELVSPPPEF